MNRFKEIFSRMVSIVARNPLAVLIIIIGVFLRFYHLPDFATFLSDQGRDAIIIKRIVSFEHWPAIGAPSSVGQIYLGPFYYYLMAPFLALFQLQPVGLAFGSAIISIFGLIITYYLINKIINKQVAVWFLFLSAFSQVNIQAARFSWNPNPLPIFSFITIYFLYRWVKTNRLLYAFLFGALFGSLFQLHHLSALMIFTFIPIYVYQLITSKKRSLSFLSWIVSLLGFVLISLPLLIFDLRHNLLNLNNLFKLFIQNNPTSQSNLLIKINLTTNQFFSHVFSTQILSFSSIMLVILLITSGVIIFRSRSVGIFVKLHWINCLTYLFLFSTFNSPRHPHYFGPIYFSFFLIVAYVLSQLNSRFVGYIFIIGYVFLNLNNLASKKPGYQIKHAQKVANFLAEEIDNKPFNIATWPVELTEDNFVYFLELKGLRPANRNKIEITNQLFVLCNQEPCQVLESPSWDISMFGKTKVAKIWTIDGVKIYKMIHDK